VPGNCPWLHTFLALQHNGSEWSISSHSHLSLAKGLSIHWWKAGLATNLRAVQVRKISLPWIKSQFFGHQIYTPITTMTELFQFVIRSSVIYKTHIFRCREHKSQMIQTWLHFNDRHYLPTFISCQFQVHICKVAGARSWPLTFIE
jgi:hypothetical protein